MNQVINQSLPSEGKSSGILCRERVRWNLSTFSHTHFNQLSVTHFSYAAYGSWRAGVRVQALVSVAQQRSVTDNQGLSYIHSTSAVCLTVSLLLLCLGGEVPLQRTLDLSVWCLSMLCGLSLQGEHVWSIMVKALLHAHSEKPCCCTAHIELRARAVYWHWTTSYANEGGQLMLHWAIPGPLVLFAGDWLYSSLKGILPHPVFSVPCQ